MSEFASIVVGVDFSLPSAAALEEAGRLAAWEGARLCVAHVLHDELLAAACQGTGLDAEEILAGRRMRLDRFCLDTLATRTVPDLELRILVGHPFAQLIRLVDRKRAGLLVLGAQGESRHPFRQLGTLASNCVRHAPCETLLVRAGHGGGFRRVVVTVDLTAGCRRAIRQAAEIVKADGGELHVLHVFAPAWKVEAVATGEVDVAPEQVAAYLERTRTRVAEFIREELPDLGGLEARIAVREHFSRGGGIVAYLNEVGADLVILGGRPRTRLDIGQAGSTAELMFHDAPCSVLTVHAEAEPWHPALESA
jgi:nucleotide-binding universal stress UspA family protein